MKNEWMKERLANLRESDEAKMWTAEVPADLASGVMLLAGMELGAAALANLGVRGAIAGTLFKLKATRTPEKPVLDSAGTQFEQSLVLAEDYHL